METDTFKYTFISCDIIVWNGIITRFGCIHMTSNEDIRLATQEEKELFKDKQRNGNR